MRTIVLGKSYDQIGNWQWLYELIAIVWGVKSYVILVLLKIFACWLSLDSLIKKGRYKVSLQIRCSLFLCCTSEIKFSIT